MLCSAVAHGCWAEMCARGPGWLKSNAILAGQKSDSRLTAKVYRRTRDASKMHDHATGLVLLSVTVTAQSPFLCRRSVECPTDCCRSKRQSTSSEILNADTCRAARRGAVEAFARGRMPLVRPRFLRARSIARRRQAPVTIHYHDPAFLSRASICSRSRAKSMGLLISPVAPPSIAFRFVSGSP